MHIDFRRTHTNEVTMIKVQTIEHVESYEYPRTIIDEKLNFDANCEAVSIGAF